VGDAVLPRKVRSPQVANQPEPAVEEKPPLLDPPTFPDLNSGETESVADPPAAKTPVAETPLEKGAEAEKSEADPWAAPKVPTLGPRYQPVPDAGPRYGEVEKSEPEKASRTESKESAAVLSPPAPLRADPDVRPVGGETLAEEQPNRDSFGRVEASPEVSRIEKPQEAAARSSEPEEAAASRPWLPLLLALCALFASLGGNLFLGWTTVEARRRLRRLIHSVRDKPSVARA
jgi:hypothetical protein